MELECTVQQYEWGKRGLASKVAALAQASNPSFEVKEDLPYAELWMGTHPNGPSRVKRSFESLSAHIKGNANCLGDKSVQTFGNQLPFLFKVLSVNKALSIQAHPDKAHAEQLHKSRPDLYKDPNHKPELAVALTPFEALCGFRPVGEIKQFLKDIPELRDVIEDSAAALIASDEAGHEGSLKLCFRALMTCPQERITCKLTQLLKRFSILDDVSRNVQQAPLVERLHSQFPTDVGCFSVYFLNHLILQPGEALYLGPNEPHAYLSGDCVECMACSDNVVRAGLTPKYKDVETLCEMLIYKGEPKESKKFRPVVEDESTKVFRPPVPDFAVAHISVCANRKKYAVIPRRTASIVVFISGEAQFGIRHLKEGSVLFLPADEELYLTNIVPKLILFQAFVNV